jgi:hypothetical protein
LGKAGGGARIRARLAALRASCCYPVRVAGPGSTIFSFSSRQVGDHQRLPEMPGQ